MKRMREAIVEGIGFWGSGLPDWDAACAWARAGQRPAQPPARPAPALLAANERRRAPATVAVALEAALAACEAAGREPTALPSVFASTHGEMSITDYMCATLASDPRAVSPTRFHNSVHNAAAGYWTIGTGAHVPATAISAGHGSFAQGLIEAMAQLAAGSEAVLLVAYDGPACGPLAEMAPSEGLLGVALVLSRVPCPGLPVLRMELAQHASMDRDDAAGPLSQLLAGNAMQPALPLLEALALERGQVLLPAGADQWLRIDIGHG